MQRDVHQKNHKDNLLQVSQENITLKARIRSLEESLQFSRGERVALELKLNHLRSNRHEADARVAELTKSCDELEAVIMTAIRLIAVWDREDAVHALQDIVANVIGSEEMALFEMRTESCGFEATAWCGVSEEQCAEAAKGLVGKVGRNGTAVFPRSGDSGITACVPLRMNHHVIGVLAIFSLLPQKMRLEHSDLVVMRFLEHHAGKLLMARLQPGEDRHI